MIIGKNKNRVRGLVKTLIITLMLAINFFNIFSSVNAENSEVKVYKLKDCGKLLTYKGIPVVISYVEYENNGYKFPAYCLDKTKPGAETGAYNVNINEKVHDVGLWRVIINGYPYKSIQELGVKTKEEAFSATKQAIYCYIHNNKVEDYAGIGEAGNRTLNALKKIVNASENSKDIQISNIFNIERISKKWEQDKIDDKYVSKVYKIDARAQINNYKVEFTNEENKILKDEIKITNMKNEEKEKFDSEEEFKILIPINKMKEDGKIRLKVTAEVKTKPVLYGKAPNSGLQDYAITTFLYEDGKENIEERYFKNNTKIIIIKKDQENNKKLEGVEFRILDKEKKPIYANLKTNREGKIEINNILPGKYYIEEVNALDGYEKNEKLIEIEIKLNQEYTVTINNLKKEEEKNDNIPSADKEINNEPVKKEEIEVEKPEKVVETNKVEQEIQKVETNIQKEIVVKRLPKTGM